MPRYSNDVCHIEFAFGMGVNDFVEWGIICICVEKKEQGRGGHVARYPQLDLFGNQRLDIT